MNILNGNEVKSVDFHHAPARLVSQELLDLVFKLKSGGQDNANAIQRLSEDRPTNKSVATHPMARMTAFEIAIATGDVLSLKHML